MQDNLEDLIYDWNVAVEQPPRPKGRKVEFDDETLRDGLQSPSVTDPGLDQKIRILHFMNDIGIDNADIGLPGAGPHVQKTVEALAREIVSAKLNVAPSAAGRTHENDVGRSSRSRSASASPSRRICSSAHRRSGSSRKSGTSTGSSSSRRKPFVLRPRTGFRSCT